MPTLNWNEFVKHRPKILEQQKLGEEIMGNKMRGTTPAKGDVKKLTPEDQGKEINTRRPRQRDIFSAAR